MKGWGKETVFKLTPTLHVYVLRAGRRERSTEERRNARRKQNKSEMKLWSHTFVCGSVNSRLNKTLTGCGRQSILLKVFLGHCSPSYLSLLRVWAY